MTQEATTTNETNELPSYYMAIQDNWYLAKNTLQKEAQEFFRSLDRVIVPASGLEEFKKRILSGIKELNEKNKRCTPIKIVFKSVTEGIHYNKNGGIRRDFDIALHGFDQLTFKLRACFEFAGVPEIVTDDTIVCKGKLVDICDNLSQFQQRLNTWPATYGQNQKFIFVDGNGFYTTLYDLKKNFNENVYPVRTYLALRDIEMPTPFK